MKALHPSIAALLSLLPSATLFAARPVARWDVIPDQRISGTFNAGVCAFHEDGVNVAFTLNGAPAAEALAPTFNPRTKVWEYVFSIDTSTLPDGPITLGARATTLSPQPESYDLPALPLYANHHHSLDNTSILWVDAVQGDDTQAGTQDAPLKTLSVAVKKAPSGSTIRLLPGTYSAAGLGGGDRPYWTTIEAAPGTDREAVQVAGGRPGTNRLRWRNLTLFCDATAGYNPILSGEQRRHSVWLDNCKTLNKQGRWAANAVVFGNRYIAYVTGGITTELTNGPDAELIRDHHVEKIASDVWTGSEKLVVNCTSHDVNGGTTGAHPDFHQSYAKEPDWVENVILYNVSGLECTCQGLFGIRLRHAAFVNVLFERTPGNYFLSQYGGPLENVLFLHVTLVQQNWAWRKGFTATDVRMLNCLLPSMSSEVGSPEGLRVDHTHFYGNKSTFGTHFTTGDPLFLDPSAHAYAPAQGSPAITGIPLPCVPADLHGNPFPKQGPRACGALTQESSPQSVTFSVK